MKKKFRYDFVCYEGPEVMLCIHCEQEKECINPCWGYAEGNVSGWDGDNAICLDCLLALPYIPVGQRAGESEAPIYHEYVVDEQ